MPKVLITNDDGIGSPMLKVLVEAFITEAFDLHVAAPAEEQSWIGRAFSRRRTVQVTPSSVFDCPAWSIGGTPSDCVNIALGHLLPELPDLVVSGINIGTNTTLPLILSSGTIAGAIEGVAWGVPSIAFSQQVEDIEAVRCHQNGNDAAYQESLRCAAAHATRLASQCIGERIEGLKVHNVNFPLHTTEQTSVRRTEPAIYPFRSLFQSAKKKGAYTFQFNLSDTKTGKDDGTDLGCLKEGCISYTVLDFAQLGRVSVTNSTSSQLIE